VRHGSLRSHVGLRARCESTPALLAKGPGFVLYAVMDFIVDQYFPVVEQLEEAFEALEEQIFTECSTRDWLPTVTPPLTVVRELAVACAPMSIEPLTVLAVPTVALSSMAIEPLTVPSVALCSPAGTWIEPLMVLAPCSVAVTSPLPATPQPLSVAPATTRARKVEYRMS